MKNHVICPVNMVSESLNYAAERSEHISFANLVQMFRMWLLATAPLVGLTRLCSAVLGEQVSVAKALHLLHAHVAFFGMILLGGDSLLLQILLVVWFAVAAWQCKRDGLKE